ncbi:MAG TPA: thioredoxin domain-containing protein [Candidatus Paceibacterota bacterium]|nr:thioredoxin domain-containing protein [Candidatus Paceibacterota bacterium]
MDTTRNSWILPGAIVAAGAILAVAIYLVRSEQVFSSPRGNPETMRPISADEHIVGNPQAPIVIVEYADLDSEYAKEFHRTLGQLMVEYGSTGQIAWVFRHFPLVNQNSNAARHAEASECVASLGNPSAFWKFIDLMQASAPDLERFDPANYGTLMKQLGIPEDAFNACLAAGTHADKVAADFEDALVAGAIASPYSIVLIEGKKPIPINGSIPYAALKNIIDSAR